MRSERSYFYYLDYYRISDGAYSSYWSGKLTNSLMRTGAKKTVDRFQERAYGYIKLQYQCIPLEFLLESLERTKPLFNVGYVIVGGKKKEFPVFLLRHKQLNVATRWFQSLIRLRKEVSLSQRIFNEIVEARYARRHVLTRRRDELFNTAVANRFNTRYIY